MFNDNTKEPLSFANPLPLTTKSVATHSVNFTVKIASNNNNSVISMLTFVANPIIYGTTVECDGVSRYFCIEGKLLFWKALLQSFQMLLFS